MHKTWFFTHAQHRNSRIDSNQAIFCTWLLWETSTDFKHRQNRFRGFGEMGIQNLGSPIDQWLRLSMESMCKFVHNVAGSLPFNILKSNCIAVCFKRHLLEVRVRNFNFWTIWQKLASHGISQNRAPWTDLNQIFRFGRHMDGNDETDIRFAVARRTCYGNQLILGAVCRRGNWPYSLFALAFHNELQ